MNEKKPNSLDYLILYAKNALKTGDKIKARDLANQAALLDPGSEEPWLILAAIGSPQESITYLNKALSIHPQSQRAKKGMQWALKRVHDEEMNEIQVEKKVDKAGSTEKQNNPKKTVKNKKITTRAKSKTRIQQKERNDLYWILPLFIVIVLIGLAVFLWFGSPVITFVLSQKSAPSEPTEAQPAAISLSEATPVISPFPTDSVAPKLTLAMAVMEIPAFTPIPPSNPASNKAFAGYFAHSWDILNPAANTGGFWLEVNLSNQMVFAYQGNNLIQSFLVSTGTSDFPTVTGTFKIYAKYPTYTMIGPGYNLPDVPYTMLFYKGYSLHGTYWHHNFGTPMSHGCVNMVTNDAAWVYQHASIGTEVIIHY